MDSDDFDQALLSPISEALAMNISFTDQQADYIALQVREGDYQNASEVVRDALRLHQVYRHRVIEALRAEMAKGWDGPSSDRSVTDILEAKQSQHCG